MELSCRLVKTEEDIERVIEFRYKFLCVWNNFCEIKKSKTESISDKFDRCSKFILCENSDGCVVGVVRLIIPDDDNLFMDQFIDRKGYINLSIKDNRFIELCEFITHKDFRNNYKIIYHLILYCSNYILHNNYEEAASISTKSVHRLLSRLGFQKCPVSFISEWGGRDDPTYLKNKRCK